MNIDPTYQSYYVYTSLLHHEKEISSGACPLVWVDSPVPGKFDLTWADGNYHLYLDELTTENALAAEERILSDLNSAGVTLGVIDIAEVSCQIRWCLLEAEQVGVLMNYPDMLEAV